MARWLQRAYHGPSVDPNDPRGKVLRRFRGFALFWIAILVFYFVGAGFVFEKTSMATSNAIPVFVLLLGCILLASIWHAAAVIVMSLNGTMDRHGPWGG